MPQEKLSFAEEAVLSAINVLSSITDSNVLSLLKSASNPEVFASTLTDWCPHLAESIDNALDSVLYERSHCKYCGGHILATPHACSLPTPIAA